MYYLKDGLGKRYGVKWLKPVSNVLAILFSCFAILASFGIGNMAQINKIVLNMDAAFFSNVSLGVIPGTQISIIHLIIGIVLMIVSGAVMEGGLAWDLSDTFNGLMMIPNLIGVVALLPLVLKITKNYMDRKIKRKNVAPILSYDDEIQKEMESSLEEEA